MPLRIRAFVFHLVGSAGVLLLVFGGLYLGWYRWPGWYLTRVLHVAIIVLCVDACLGPLCTLLIANPKKPRRELSRDVAIIVLVQLVALVYGAATLWQGRPLYYAFSVDRLELVQANDIQSDEAALARKLNPDLAPHWYSLPRWVYAPLPENKDESAKIALSAVFGGKDVIQMPKYFKPWAAGLPMLKGKLIASKALPYFSPHQREVLSARLARLGVAPDSPTVMLLTGDGRLMVAVFQRDPLQITAIVAPE
ncbi:MAG TPA: hypothetical protein VLW26_03445 [Steroidobacteraceae bacterium]|nr:hypothetical protein [Steroidobacteraceae bacterium]